MTYNQTLRVVLFAGLTFLLWRIAPGFGRNVWWLVGSTALAYVMFLGLIAYTYFCTRSSTPARPSAVRSRLQSAVNRGRHAARQDRAAESE